MVNDEKVKNKVKHKPWLAIIMVGVVCTCLNNENFVFAGSSTDSLGVNATVNPNCRFIGASAVVSFGLYDPIVLHALVPNIASGTFSVLCTRLTPAQITMGSGLHSSFASGTTRAMSNGSGDYLSYEIYTTAGLSLVWNLVNTVSYTNIGGGPSVITIFASIPPAQSIAAGNYTDTVVTTINY
jgi:spore coat protein U-like protein